MVGTVVLFSVPSESKVKDVDAFGQQPPQHQSNRRALGSSSSSNKPRDNNSGNPGGSGGSSDSSECESEDDYRSKKKKQSAEQCELDENVKERKIEIVYRIKENSALVNEAEKMGKDQAAQKDVNHLIEQLSLGNENPGIGSEPIGGGISELRGYNEGRVYYRKLRKPKKTVYKIL